MYQLQVLEADRYKLLAEQNRINAHPLLPPRGLLLDRFGMPIAGNRSSFAVILRRDEIAEPAASLRSLAQLISLDASEMDRMMVGTTRHPPFVPVGVREALSWQPIAMIEVTLPDLHGIGTVPTQAPF